MNFSKFLSQALALLLMDKGRVIALQGAALIAGSLLLCLGENPLNITIISIVNLFISFAIIYRLYAIKQGANPNLYECIKVSFERGPKVVLAMLLLIGLSFLAIMPVFSLLTDHKILSNMYVGMMAFLLLGGCFIKILVIIENLGAVASLKQSFKLAFNNMPKIILAWFTIMYCLPYFSLFMFKNIIVQTLSTLWLLVCSAFLIVVYDYLKNR